jgi:hypothetical protein
VIAAIKVCALAEKVDGVIDMSLVMGSFVDNLTFKEMIVVLKDKEGREQVRHLILCLDKITGLSFHVFTTIWIISLFCLK